MARIEEHEIDNRTQPSLKRRMLFMGFLLAASTLVYAELVMRFSN